MCLSHPVRRQKRSPARGFISDHSAPAVLVGQWREEGQEADSESTHTDTFLPSFQPLPTVTEKCDVYGVASERFDCWRWPRTPTKVGISLRGHRSTPFTVPCTGTREGGWGNKKPRHEENSVNGHLEPIDATALAAASSMSYCSSFPPSGAQVASLFPRVGRHRRDRHDNALHICFEDTAWCRCRRQLGVNYCRCFSSGKPQRWNQAIITKRRQC